MKHWLAWVAWVGVLSTSAAWAQSPPPQPQAQPDAQSVPQPQPLPGDTMLTPRGRTEYEKHLAELNAKYGADKAQVALKEAVLSANAAPSKEQTGAGVARVALPADLVPGQKLKVELLPHGDNQFLFQDEVFDALGLEDALAAVKRTYVIDQIILLANPERTIQIDHLLELARIGRDLEVTTAYQQGGELKLISAK